VTPAEPFSLRPLYNAIAEVIPLPGETDEDTGCIVILDDIASLEWIGISSKELIRFARALQGLSAQVPILAQPVIVENANALLANSVTPRSCFSTIHTKSIRPAIYCGISSNHVMCGSKSIRCLVDGVVLSVAK